MFEGSLVVSAVDAVAANNTLNSHLACVDAYAQCSFCRQCFRWSLLISIFVSALGDGITKQVFKVDVVLVMSNDRLFSSLSASVAESIAVVKLPRSGGVVNRVSSRSFLSHILTTHPSHRPAASSYSERILVAAIMLHIMIQMVLITFDCRRFYGCCRFCP